jgi:hypothetical protein
VRFIFDLSTIALPFFLLALAQPHARSAAVLVDELDAGGFECAPNDIQSCTTRLTNPDLELVHGYNADARRAREILLAPTDQASGGPALGWGEHLPIMPENT